MRNWKCSFGMSIALLVATGVTMRADTLNGSGAWQSWSPAILGTPTHPTYGGPFWNNLSGDGIAANIGWCLVGGGTCSIANPPGALNFFGNGNSYVRNMWFSSGGSGVTVSLAGVFTTQTTTRLGLDYFGYYTLDSSGHVTSPTQLFSAADALSITASFTVNPNTNYGFYLENIQGQGTPNETDYWFYMDSTQDTTNRGISLTPFQHFAVFDSGANGYYFGIEDSISGMGDQDYNDMIISMNIYPTVPEPGPTALVALGLVGLALSLRAGKLVRSSLH